MTDNGQPYVYDESGNPLVYVGPYKERVGQCIVRRPSSSLPYVKNIAEVYVSRGQADTDG